MRYTIILSLCLIAIVVKAQQEDTLLLVYPEIGNINAELLVLEGNRYGIIQSKQDAGFGVLITDEDGTTLFHETVNHVGGLDIEDCSFMFEDSLGYYFIGNCYKNGSPYFFSIKAQKDLAAWEVLDTVPLGDDSFLFFNMMKYNAYKSQWEGFGDVQSISNFTSTEQVYLSLNPDFKFNLVQHFLGELYPSPILDFLYIPKFDKYFIDFFGPGNYIVSDDLTELDTLFIRHSYLRNNITYHSYMDPQSCFLTSDSTFDCFSTNAFGHPDIERYYGISDITIGADSVWHSTTYLNKQDYPKIDNASLMRIDSSGNYVMAGVDSKGKLFANPTVPNILGVLNLDASKQYNWDIQYHGLESFIVWDFEIDQNGDVVIVGDSRNLIGPHERAGFLFKVYKDGTYTVSNLGIPKDEAVILFPNPCSDFINVSSKSGKKMILNVTNALGQTLLKKEVVANEQLNVMHLPIGSYFYSLADKKERLIKAGILLKN